MLDGLGVLSRRGVLLVMPGRCPRSHEDGKGNQTGKRGANGIIYQAGFH